MKKNLLSVVAACAIIAASFTACQKDVAMKNVAPSANESIALTNAKNESVVAKAPPLTYAACNMLVTIYDPAPGLYTLAMSTATGYKKFGLPDFSGTLNFQNIDYLTFEFAKQYADAANTVKLYRIRRSDGKYLTLYTVPFL